MMNFKSKLAAINEKEVTKEEHFRSVLNKTFDQILKDIDRILTNFDKKQWCVGTGIAGRSYTLNESECPKSNGVGCGVSFRGESLTVRFFVQKIYLGLNYNAADYIQSEEFRMAALTAIGEIKASTDIDSLEVACGGVILAKI